MLIKRKISYNFSIKLHYFPPPFGTLCTLAIAKGSKESEKMSQPCAVWDPLGPHLGAKVHAVKWGHWGTHTYP